MVTDAHRSLLTRLERITHTGAHVKQTKSHGVNLEANLMQAPWWMVKTRDAPAAARAVRRDERDLGSFARVADATWLLGRHACLAIHGRTVLSLRGAASVDRGFRVKGLTWRQVKLSPTSNHAAAVLLYRRYSAARVLVICSARTESASSLSAGIFAKFVG